MSNVKAEYRLWVPVVFEYSDDIDPFYFVDDGKRVWRMKGLYSDITTEGGIWDHLAYNAIVNGVDDASRLDGWGDLGRGQLTMRIVRSELDFERD